MGSLNFNVVASTFDIEIQNFSKNPMDGTKKKNMKKKIKLKVTPKVARREFLQDQIILFVVLIFP